MKIDRILTLSLLIALAISPMRAQAEDAPKRLLLMAGKPSHPPRMHEFNAGVKLLAGCLQDFPGIKVDVALNGWPKVESVLNQADAIVFYMDGSGKHELVQEGRRRLEMADAWAKKGVGLGFMHYGVEIQPDVAGDEFKRWMGGHYEHMFSCNPMWEPKFTNFPKHPITNGVKPFEIRDEWYFNMRFISELGAGNEAKTVQGTKFVPILVAAPSDAVRGGPYVYPKGPYPHIQASQGRAEAMMWCVERPDGGRGFGFTGGHFHDNWSNDQFRKVVLNAVVWLAKAEVPSDGVQSAVSQEKLNANLDPKLPRRKR